MGMGYGRVEQLDPLYSFLNFLELGPGFSEIRTLLTAGELLLTWSSAQISSPRSCALPAETLEVWAYVSESPRGDD